MSVKTTIWVIANSKGKWFRGFIDDEPSFVSPVHGKKYKRKVLFFLDAESAIKKLSFLTRTFPKIFSLCRIERTEKTFYRSR